LHLFEHFWEQVVEPERPAASRPDDPALAENPQVM